MRLFKRRNPGRAFSIPLIYLLDVSKKAGTGQRFRHAQQSIRKGTRSEIRLPDMPVEQAIKRIRGSVNAVHILQDLFTFRN